MAEQDFNNFSPVDIPDVPNAPNQDVSSIIEQEGQAAAQGFVPLSDPGDSQITPQSFQPFDGDPVPFDLPGMSTQKHILGYPDENPGGFGVASQDDITNWIQSGIRDSGNQPGEYAQTFLYDAGPKTNSFYKRYAAYGDDKFSEIGFHPFVDNEANFVQRTNMWDDWSRMLTHSFPVLLKRGFIDGPKSLVKGLMGDFTGADLADSKEYAEAAAIGQSSREGGLTGFSAFMNNTVMNFGYTAGIITEAILEEVAMSYMTIGSAGMTAGAQAARSKQLGDHILNALGKFGSGYKQIKKLLPKISSTPTAARGYWSGLRSAGRILNPLENTVDAARTISRNRKAYNAGKTTSYINGLGILSKTAGSLYRDARAINMAVSEARLEAGMVENDIYKELTDDYYKKNLKNPTTEEQLGMRIRAKQGSLETFYSNAGIIYVTNQITFRNVVAPKGGIRNFFKGVQKDLYNVEGAYGKLGKVIYDRSKEAFKFQKRNLMTLAKSWYKEPGLKTLKKTLGYFKANVSEGIQENLQETIARANIAHYVDAYKTEGVSSALYAKGVNGVSYSAQMGTSADKYFDELAYEYTSKQGFETFMSGFLMGTFARPLNQAIPFLSKHYNRIYDKEGYQKWIKRKGRDTIEIVNKLNELGGKEGMKTFLDNRILNLATQEEVAQILKFGSKYEALNAQLDAFVESLDLLRQTNTESVFTEKLEHMLELSDQELADAVQSLDAEQAPKYRERITKAISTFKNIDAVFKRSEELFPNPVSFNEIDFTKEGLENPENLAKFALYRAWNQSVKNFVYLNAAFVDTTQRMEDIYRDYLKVSSLSEADYGAVKVLFKEQDINSQIQILKTEVENEEGNTKKAREAKKQIELLENFKKARSLFNAFYNIDEYYSDIAQSDDLKARIERVRPGTKVTEEDVIGEGERLKEQENQDKILNDLKEAHDAYIKYLAKINEATVFQTQIDDAYNKLLDFYKLSYETRFLATSVDILTDPGQFLELVMANQRAQEEIKKKMPEIHKELVESQVDDVAFDSLVKNLHKIGLVFNTDQDMEDLQKKKIIPKTLKGESDSKEYGEGTPEYNAGLALINQYIGQASVKPSPASQNVEEMTDSMQESVSKLEKLIAQSKEYSELGENYMRNSDIYSRVSNVASEIIGEEYDYAFLDQVLTEPGSAFNVVFLNAKKTDQKDENGKFIFTKGKFNFTKEKIEQYIEFLKFKQDEKNSISGLNDKTYKAIRDNLSALLNKTELPIVKEQIDKLKALLTKDLTDAQKDIIQKRINDLSKKELLNPTEKNAIEVLSLIFPKSTYQAARDRGNNLDDITRDYFDLSIKNFSYDKYKDKISKAAFDSLYGPSGILKSLKDAQTAGDIVIYSKDLTIGSAKMSNNKSVAGTMDLVVVDKSGQVFIIDLKTQSEKDWNEYGLDNSFNGQKFAKHMMQVLGYTNLMFNESDIQAKGLILPIATTENKETGKVETAKLPEESSKFINSKKDTIVKGKLFIDVNRKTAKGNNVVIELPAQLFPEGKAIDVNQIDTMIPRKGTKAPPTKQPPPTVKRKPFEKYGNHVVLDSLKTIDKNFIADFLGDFVYITVGVGGYQIAQENKDDFVHTDDLFAEELDKQGFSRKQNEALNDWLYRYAKEKKSKAQLNKDVLERVRELNQDGVTVITSTVDFIKEISPDSVIITTNILNENFTSAFESNDAAVSFLKKETEAVNNRNNNSYNTLYEDFVKEINESTDTLSLYERLKTEDFTAAEQIAARNMIDIRAKLIINPAKDVLVKTATIYTFANDISRLSITSGDKVNVISIDSKNKTVNGKISKAIGQIVEFSYDEFIDGISEDSPSNVPGNKDNLNSDAVAQYLNNLNAEMKTIDENGRDFETLNNLSDQEKFDIFKCN